MKTLCQTKVLAEMQTFGKSTTPVSILAIVPITAVG